MSSSINNLNAPQMCSFFCSHHFNCIQNIYTFFINVIFAMCIMLYNFDCRRQWSKKWALAWAKISLNSFHTLNMTTFIHCSKDEFCSHKHGLNCTCIRQLFRRSFFDVFFLRYATLILIYYSAHAVVVFSPLARVIVLFIVERHSLNDSFIFQINFEQVLSERLQWISWHFLDVS